MKPLFTILIADRNPNVREFLKRELTTEGYRIRLARSAREVLFWAYSPDQLDLIVLDPDLPDDGGWGLLEKIEDRIPTLPVVLHMHASDYEQMGGRLRPAAFVEKQGSSVENLKNVVKDILTGSAKQRSRLSEENGTRFAELNDEKRPGR